MRQPPEIKENKEKIVCPACDKTIASNAIDGYAGYRLYHCLTCDLMFWYPMKGATVGYYETLYDASPDLTPFKAVKILWAQQQFLKEAPAKGGQLLDIGCGLGDFLFEARQAGYSVTGIDFSLEFIEIARRRFGLENLYALTPEQFVADKPDNKYDVITFFEVLEHLDRITDFVALVKSRLKPGGYIVCSLPNRDRWRFFSKELSLYASQERDYPPHHLTRWNLQALSNLFERYGFAVIDIGREPLTWNSFVYGGWLISSKLGIQNRSMAFAKKLASTKADKNEAGQKPQSSKLRSLIIKTGGWFYYKVFILLLGLVALPAWLLLRSSGASNYLLARLNETS